MATKLRKLKASGSGGDRFSGAPKCVAGKGVRWTIDEWRLTKVNNGEKLGEICYTTNTSDKSPYYFLWGTGISIK